MNYLSTNIKHLRQQRRLTQEELASTVGKARSLVSQWESDDRGITTEDIIKLSDYFNIPMDTLVGKDLRIANNSVDELDILFDKNKDILTESDKNIMKAIITERRKQIDKELGEMTNETIKVILGIIGFIIIVLLINDYNVSKDNDDKYSVILNDKKISVCGQEIYVTNYTYNDEILLDDLIDEIEYICQN